MTVVRDQLIAAFASNDYSAIRRLGWWEAWDALSSWWTLPQKLTHPLDGAAYASALGSHEPDRVVNALRQLGGKFRPAPGEVLGEVNRQASDVRPVVNHANDRHPFNQPTALAAVLEAVQAGEHECDCGFHGSRFRHDPLGVLRCRDCRGLEAGQVDDAEGVAA